MQYTTLDAKMNIINPLPEIFLVIEIPGWGVTDHVSVIWSGYHRFLPE